MGTESNSKPLQLTANDPVDATTLKRLSDLTTRRHQLGDHMINLEQEKVKVLVESRRVDDERNKIFAHILTARGQAPDAAVEIDPTSGKLFLGLRQAPGEGAVEAPSAPAAVPQPE